MTGTHTLQLGTLDLVKVEVTIIKLKTPHHSYLWFLLMGIDGSEVPLRAIIETIEPVVGEDILLPTDENL